jgi:hypothetical protein
MARPGLEPGTPRFSGSRRRRCCVTKGLQNHLVFVRVIPSRCRRLRWVSRRFGTPRARRSPNRQRPPTVAVSTLRWVARLPGRSQSFSAAGLCDARIPDGSRVRCGWAPGAILYPVSRATFGICGYRVPRTGCFSPALRLVFCRRTSALLIPHTRANAGWRRLWAADSATNATTPPRIASDLKPTAGFRSMSSQMAISGEPTAVVPAALAGVFDGGGVSSDRKFAMSGRSKGVALASGVKCRGYGVRSAA